MENVHISIAIDGPVAAGKTTQAKALAQELGCLYADTGAMYRTVALFMRRRRKTMRDIDEVLDTIDMSVERDEDGGQRMFLGREDVTGQLRTQDISRWASNISAIPKVRDFLLDMQRDLAKGMDVVMEGRDIASVILPEATVKVFLTAHPKVRAQRRWLELQEHGGPVSLEQVFRELVDRDYQDSHREVAPLKRPEDAVLVDCTALTVPETTRCILDIVTASVHR